jgi:hypothetical protein
LRNVVLTSPAADARTRDALTRALKRLPADVDVVPFHARGARLREIAAQPDVELIAIVDDDAVLQADAFGALRRAFGGAAAIVGGRALVGVSQCLGSMLAPVRSGPNPFELVPLMGIANDRQMVDLVRGPIDVPQRGVVVVSADFVRSLPAAELDAETLYLDLAVYARAAGRAVVCEPSMTFSAEEDPIALRRALLNLRRYAGIGTWNAVDMHRDPPRIRTGYITREARVMGNLRGFARRPLPPIDVLAVATDEMTRARVQRSAGAIGNGGRVTMCAANDGDAVRRELARTGDRYLLVTDGITLPSRATVDVLAERLERNGRTALALDAETAPFGAALFHCGRIAAGGLLPGATVLDVVTNAIATLPERRLFAAGPAGEIVPAVLPVPSGIRRLDAVFIAASKPVVTQQTLEALLGDPVDGSITVVYPAGAATTERLASVYRQLVLAPDESDVHLAVGLNRALAASTADGIAIVRDDAQLPRGFFPRLQDAFRRMPRLGVAVPRVGGADRPESLPDLGYRNSAEMQSLYDRRADAFAREATLLDVATAPVMIVSREVLDIVGGFDEMFGFSRLGVEDFTRRVRAANFLVAVCDDAYVHLFPPLDAASLVGSLDDTPFLRAAYQKRWSVARGFEPERDRVEMGRAAALAPAAAVQGTAVRILMPLANADEWALARPLLVDLAATFRVHDAVEVAIGLDGTFGLQTALAEIRELLTASNVPMDQTINVSIDFVPDIAEWRDAGVKNLRAATVEREALDDVRTIDGSAAVRAFIAEQGS